MWINFLIITLFFFLFTTEVPMFGEVPVEVESPFSARSKYISIHYFMYSWFECSCLFLFLFFWMFTIRYDESRKGPIAQSSAHSTSGTKTNIL